MSKQFYAPKPSKEKGSRPPTTRGVKLSANTPTLPMLPSACELVRFVLKSGAALELQTDTIDEVVESIAGKQCHAICGCTPKGEMAAVEWDNVDYMIEVKQCS